MQRTILLILLAGLSLPTVTGASAADQPVGPAGMLCSTTIAVACRADGECESGPAWIWNIPDFIEVDLEAGTLTTAAENPRHRTTPIDVVRRDDGLLLLQGLENRRVFSIVVAEDVGSLTSAIILEDLVVTVFGSCTSMPAAE